MARQMTIPAEWWKLAGRTELAIALGDRFKADGAMFNAWRVAGEFYIPERRGIPLVPWEAERLPRAIIEVGLATVEKDGMVHLWGLELVWGWWFDQSFAGNKSVEARIKKYGTALPRNAPNHVRSNFSNGVRKTPNDDPNAPNLFSSSSSKEKPSSSSSNSNTVRGEANTVRTGANTVRGILNTVLRTMPKALAENVDNLVISVDKIGRFYNAPLRQPHFSYGATDGSLALNPWEGTKTLLEGKFDGLEILQNVESDNVYPDKLRQVNIPDEIPSCGSVRLLRIYPQYEDFQSHAEWTLAQYPPINAISAYRESIRCRPRDYQDAQAAALRRLREELNLDVFRIAAAIRDVQRNGTLEKRAHPKEGIAVYLLSRAKLILSRIESHRYQQERRKLAAGRARMRRRFQERSPRVHAFRDAFRDRRARRLEMDRQRELYPVIFREVPRSSVAELSVCAGLWVQR